MGVANAQHAPSTRPRRGRLWRTCASVNPAQAPDVPPASFATHDDVQPANAAGFTLCVFCCEKPWHALEVMAAAADAVSPPQTVPVALMHE